MKQYTLLIMTSDKVVHTRTFLSKEELFQQKRYFINNLRDAELQQVDRDGYVWFAEVNSDKEE